MPSRRVRPLIPVEEIEPHPLIDEPAEAPWYQRLLRIRVILLVIAVASSVVIYLYLLQAFDKQKTLNIFEDVSRATGTTECSFFSGSQLGFYIQMGEALEERTEQSSKLRFRNVMTGGGLENARRVASTPMSFGVMQEDTLGRKNFLREHIRLVSPLYLERMHIIYDANAYRDFVAKLRAEETLQTHREEGGEDQPSTTGAARSSRRSEEIQPPVLTVGGEEDLIEFFKSSDTKISTGPVGSGSRIFAKYVLSMCGVSKYNDLGLSFQEATNRINAGSQDLKVDVIFTIAGAPLESVREILSSAGGGQFKLMSVDPSVIPELNDKYDLRLNRADFQDKYVGGNSVSTFASWAFMICSRDVSDVAIARALYELREAKDEIGRRIGVDDSKEQFQLDEFSFYESHIIGMARNEWRVARNLLIFVGFMLVMTTTTFVFLSWLISSLSVAMYYRQLTSIHEDALEDNWTLIRNEGEFPCPVIHEDQKEIIANLITGISELAGVTIRIRAGYNTGEVGFRDRTRLLEVIEEFRSVFRRNLGRRLNEFYSNYGEFDTVAFRHLHTAGYIEHHDYERMYEEFGAKGGEEGDPPLNVAGHGAVFGGRKPRIFLSYRRDDTNFAVGRLREKLIDAVGNENVFQDINIPPGRDFHGFIEQEIARCDILIAVIGVNWTKPIHVRAASGELDYVRLEIETAIEKGKTVIPALLAPAELPALTELPGDMRPLLHCQACTVRPDPDFHNSADRLVEAIVHEFSSQASLEE